MGPRQHEYEAIVELMGAAPSGRGRESYVYMICINSIVISICIYTYIYIYIYIGLSWTSLTEMHDVTQHALLLFTPLYSNLLYSTRLD